MPQKYKPELFARKPSSYKEVVENIERPMKLNEFLDMAEGDTILHRKYETFKSLFNDDLSGHQWWLARLDGKPHPLAVNTEGYNYPRYVGIIAPPESMEVGHLNIGGLEGIVSTSPNTPKAQTPKLSPGVQAGRQYLADLAEFDASIQKRIYEGKVSLSEEDYEQAGLAFSDASDLTEIYDAINEGRFDYARNVIRSLDTAARDYIPQRVYDRHA